MSRPFKARLQVDKALAESVDAIQGATCQFSILVEDAVSGEPVDLTGATVALPLANADGSTLTLGVGTGITLASVKNRMDVVVSAAQTALLALQDDPGAEIAALVTLSAIVTPLRLEDALRVKAL
jgi:hypothetical protein